MESSQDDLRLYRQGGFMISESEGGINTESEYNESVDYATEKKIKQNRDRRREEGQVKQKYQALISMLEKQIEYQQRELEKQKSSMERQLQDKERLYQETVQQMRQEARKREERGMVENERNILIKQNLTLVREMLNQQVSETKYLRLRELREEDLQIEEYVLVNVYEMLVPFRSQQEDAQKQVSNYQEQIKGLNDRLQRNLNELEHSQKLLFDKEQDYKRYLIDYNTQKKLVEQQLESKSKELEEMLRENNQQGALLQANRALEQEKQLLKQKVELLEKERDGNLTQIESRRQVDLLRQDKEYLSKENIQLQEKNKRLEDRYDRVETDLQEAKRREQDYLAQLLHSRANAATDYEQKFTKELYELKEKHAYELQVSKGHQTEMYERQLRFMQEQKEESQTKAERLEHQLKERDQEYRELVTQQSQVTQRVDQDMAELRVSYRLKAEELLRISNLYSEFKSNYTDLESQLAIKNEKLQALKNEYYAQQLQHKEQVMYIQGQLELQKEKLLDYQNIELELDRAIEGVGSNSDNVYLATLQTMPTSKKCRVQQAMELSKRLCLKTEQAAQLEQQVLVLQEQLQENNKLQVKQQELIENSNKPYSYLVQNIQEKDKEILQQQQVLRKQEQDYHYLKQENNDLQQMVANLKGDIQRIMIKRDNIQGIQQLLMNNIQQGQADTPQVVQKIESLLNTHAKPPPSQDQPERDRHAPLWYQKLKGTMRK